MVWGYCTCADFPFIDAVAYLAHSQVSPLVTGKVMCCNFLIWPILPAWCNDGDIYYGVLSLQGGVGILTMLRCEDKPQFVPPCLRCASNQALSFARKFSWAGGGGGKRGTGREGGWGEETRTCLSQPDSTFDKEMSVMRNSGQEALDSCCHWYRGWNRFSTCYFPQK